MEFTLPAYSHPDFEEKSLAEAPDVVCAAVEISPSELIMAAKAT